jgi:DNA-binding response OmpR family regulator
MEEEKEVAKILVADDDEAALRHALRALREYEVVGVGDGAMALELIERNDFSLVVLDARMPGLDGLEVCGRLRSDERTRDIPILLLTEPGASSDEEEGRKRGADDCLAKPCDPEELRGRARALLEKGRGKGAV